MPTRHSGIPSVRDLYEALSHAINDGYGDIPAMIASEHDASNIACESIAGTGIVVMGKNVSVNDRVVKKSFVLTSDHRVAEKLLG